jgi:predicted dehydrogenase
VIQSLAVRWDGNEAAIGDRIRLGLVGAGLVAQVAHLPELAALDDRFEVVAVAEPDARAARTVARRHGIPRVYGDCEAMLDGGLDAVLVCSPNATHADVVLAALDAGVHVLVEKPLCLEPADGDRIVAARDHTGLTVQVGYMKRFDPAYEALLADLPDRLLHVVTETYDPGLREPFGAPPGGVVDVYSDVVLGALVHDVNLVRGVLDRCGLSVARVADAFAGPDAAGGTLVLDDGTRCTLVWLHLPGLGDFRERVVVYAADGVRSLEFPAPYLRQAPTTYANSTGTAAGNETRTLRSWREAYRRQLEHFHACVTGGAECRTPAEQGAADIHLLSAMFAEAVA